MKKLISVLLAIILAAGLITASFAESAEDDAYYRKRVAEYEDMKTHSIHVTIDRTSAWYSLKSSKFYGRKITGVAPDGSWILGPWELLSTYSGPSTNFTISWTYFAFAYSFDIVWGTDWPYSGVFWSKPDERPTHLDIYPAGSVRMASITIKLDGKTVVDESNCSSHSEWTPS